MFEETDQELSFSEILVPYLKNPSEEDIFGSNNIKEEHEKWNFKIKRLFPKTLKTLSNELNRPMRI